MAEIHYLKTVHFQPLRDIDNVRCLNGSAHIWRTRDITQVTCKLCLDENTHKDYWREKDKNTV